MQQIIHVQQRLFIVCRRNPNDIHASFQRQKLVSLMSKPHVLQCVDGTAHHMVYVHRPLILPQFLTHRHRCDGNRSTHSWVWSPVFRLVGAPLCLYVWVCVCESSCACLSQCVCVSWQQQSSWKDGDKAKAGNRDRDWAKRQNERERDNLTVIF